MTRGHPLQCMRFGPKTELAQFHVLTLCYIILTETYWFSMKLCVSKCTIQFFAHRNYYHGFWARYEKEDNSLPDRIQPLYPSMTLVSRMLSSSQTASCKRPRRAIRDVNMIQCWTSISTIQGDKWHSVFQTAISFYFCSLLEKTCACLLHNKRSSHLSRLNWRSMEFHAAAVPADWCELPCRLAGKRSIISV